MEDDSKVIKKNNTIEASLLKTLASIPRDIRFNLQAEMNS